MMLLRLMPFSSIIKWMLRFLLYTPPRLGRQLVIHGGLIVLKCQGSTPASKHYKRRCSVVKQVAKQAKRVYWREYCLSFTKDSSISKNLRMVRRMININQTFTYSDTKDTSENLQLNLNKSLSRS